MIINSRAAFSLDYDQGVFSFDPTDSNGDGIPDALTFNLPETFQVWVSFDASDSNGEIDIVLFSFAAAPAPLPDGVLGSVTLTALQPVENQAAIRFSPTVPVSFGNAAGQSQPGDSADGSVDVALRRIYLPLIFRP